MISIFLALQVATAATSPSSRPKDTDFARTVAALSEPGGFFWSDNLVSNETSYLHVIPKLERLGVHGGAYIGVGPEQNFSYIARVRPEIAFIIDVRQDNLLLHLFFKAIFERANSRLEYLCLLYARRCPSDLAIWKGRSIEDLVGYIDAAPADSAFRVQSESELFGSIWTFGVPVADSEFATIRRLHDEFVERGLDLQFTAYGRRAIANFPTVRQLYLERDLSGKRQSFLVDEASFLVVQRLERADKVIPVVGDLGGPKALRAIGSWLAERNQKVSLFYLSNIEFYLLRQGTFDQFVANVKSLPTGPNSLLTRSYFGVQTGMVHPNQQPGHLSVQLLQFVPRFLEVARSGDDVSYWRLMTEALEPLDFDRASFH